MNLENKKRLNKAYDAGYEAAEMGDGANACPHADGTRVWHAWMLGYYSHYSFMLMSDMGYDPDIVAKREYHALCAFSTVDVFVDGQPVAIAA